MAAVRVVTQRLVAAGSQPGSRGQALAPQQKDWLRLAPRGIGELLDQSFDVYVAHFGQLVGFAALCFVPLFLVFDSLVLPWLLSEGLHVLVSLLRDSIPTLLASALVVYSLAASFLGPQRGFGSLVLRSLGSLPGLLVLSVIRFVLMILGCCMLLVPGVLVIWLMAACMGIYLLEGRALVEAHTEDGRMWLPFRRLLLSIGRSFRLTASLDSLGRFFGAGIVISLLLIPMMGISGLQDNPMLRAELMSMELFDSNLARLVMVVLGAVGQAAGWVFFYVFSTLFYFDLRVRREALDLDLELDQLMHRSAR